MAAAASAGAQAVEKQLKICGIKRNVDVSIFYLAGQGLRSIPSLSRFHRLRYLWINNNKIQDLTFLIKNYCLTELYLNHNELTDISGALKHLCALQILFLHNNQLQKLVETVKELKGKISLHTLSNTLFYFAEQMSPYVMPNAQYFEKTGNKFHVFVTQSMEDSIRSIKGIVIFEVNDSNLFHNPLAQDPDYRLYVIHALPSVQLLDRKAVTQRERESALQLYNRERSCVVQPIAFGKRVSTVLGPPLGSGRARAQPDRRLTVPSGSKSGNHTKKVPFENPEDAVLVRAMTRSVMEFSCVDWNKVATCQERRLENKMEEPLEKMTIQFR